MNVAWDMRLFSLGYACRGVGVYAKAVAEAVLSQDESLTLWVIGERSRIQPHIPELDATWIEYSPAGWRRDFLGIPRAVRRVPIDLYHYWIALGPLHQLGMAAFLPCPSCATVYDLGAELWTSVPFLRSVRRSWYWRVQKLLASRLHAALCISEATRRDLERVVRPLRGKTQVVYPPAAAPQRDSATARRDPCFVTLAGAPNKNLAAVLDAFSLLNRPDMRLVVLGDVDREGEMRGPLPRGVSFEPMERYRRCLDSCAGLVVCSTHEGLGLPPIDAMACGCPLLVSDIAVFRETCEGAAVFADPLSPSSIAGGMRRLLDERPLWEQRSAEGYRRYRRLCGEPGAAVVDVYRKVLGRKP